MWHVRLRTASGGALDEPRADRRVQRQDEAVGRQCEEDARLPHAAEIDDRDQDDRGERQLDAIRREGGCGRGDREDPAGDGHGDGEDVVDEQRSARDERRDLAEVLLGDDVGAAGLLRTRAPSAGTTRRRSPSARRPRRRSRASSAARRGRRRRARPSPPRSRRRPTRSRRRRRSAARAGSAAGCRRAGPTTSGGRRGSASATARTVTLTRQAAAAGASGRSTIVSVGACVRIHARSLGVKPDGGRDDPVETLDLPEPAQRVGQRPALLDARVDRDPGSERRRARPPRAAAARRPPAPSAANPRGTGAARPAGRPPRARPPRCAQRGSPRRARVGSSAPENGTRMRPLPVVGRTHAGGVPADAASLAPSWRSARFATTRMSTPGSSRTSAETSEPRRISRRRLSSGVPTST